MLSHPFAIFCPYCSKDSEIVNGVFDCCAEVPTCLQCDEPRSAKKRRDAKFCSPACRLDSFLNPRLKSCCTIAELAERSGVSAASIRRMIKAGKITAHKFGPIYLVSKTALKRKQDAKPADVIPVRPEIAEGFRVFAAANDLSVRQFAEMIGIGKSSVHRLMTGTAAEDYFQKIVHTLPTELRI